MVQAFCKSDELAQKSPKDQFLRSFEHQQRLFEYSSMDLIAKITEQRSIFQEMRIPGMQSRDELAKKQGYSSAWPALRKK